MVELVLTDAQHSYVASTKKITLAAPYTTLSEGQVLRIFNLTTNDLIYSYEHLQYPISIAGAVITHTANNTNHQDTDLLQVIIDIGGSAALPIHISSGGVVASTVGDGRAFVTTPGTAVALAASTAIKEVTVTAETNNTDIIVVGGSTVVAALATRRGIPLYPGDSFTIESDNLAEVYIDAEVGTEGVTYSYLA